MRGKKEIKGEDIVLSDETQRQISKSSMLSYEEDSAGGGVYLCATEVPTNDLASAFIENVIGVWGGSAPLTFTPPGRKMELIWQR